MTKRSQYLGVLADFRAPTRSHRPAIWENMLGTVFAMNDVGEVKYFDYNHEDAKRFAGAEEDDRDPRTWKVTISSDGRWRRDPGRTRFRQTVLFVRRHSAVTTQ